MTTARDIFEMVSLEPTEEISPVVRSIFNDTTAKAMLGWTVESLRSESFGVGTLALMKVSGKAHIRGEVRPWSSVLKIMDCTPIEKTASVGTPIREVAAYKSGLFNGTATGLRSAKIHHISEKQANIVWLWTEDLTAKPGQFGYSWSSYQYFTIAETLGQFKGQMLRTVLPPESWMNYNAGITRWTSPAMMNLCKTLEQHSDSDYVRTVMPCQIFDRVLEFESEILLLARAIEHVPMTLAHGDFHIRNMFTQLGHDGVAQVVAIDLASVGIEPIGVDIGTLIGASLTWGDEEADAVMSIEREVFNSFVHGLRVQGCVIPEDTIRLGYLGTLCGYARSVGTIPSTVAHEYGPWEWVLKRYGGSKQQLPYSYRRRIEFAVAIFDEAVGLVRRLGYR
ncbi:MAG: phosphotransferase [Chloroflexi bacterium]|nr:phosphotransferase [Chloroflexota bacterium]